MRFLRQLMIRLLSLWLAANASGAGVAAFRHQTIDIPTRTAAWQAWRMSLFGDIDNDGLDDLLAIDPLENRLWVYRQKASGFPATPDQTIEMPPQTAWVALCDVDAYPGVELLMSTATGLVYLRQNRGVFELPTRPLIEANQVFTHGDPPILISLDGHKDRTNTMIPVITAEHVVLYRRNQDFVWSPAREVPLSSGRSHWQFNRGEWMMGAHPSRSLQLQQSFHAAATESETARQKAESEAVRRILKDMEKELAGGSHGVNHLDVNGDRQEDLILWRLTGDLDPKTDVFVYLREADTLPERPTQVLHCRGFPIPAGSHEEISPLCDINGDGAAELILVALRTSIVSWSSVVDMVMTRGVDCALTIRSFKNGAYSRSPDASLDLTTMVPGESGLQANFLVTGDFNGDGRQDVLVKRTLTQWDVFLSVVGKGWFAPQPALTLETPFEGFFKIGDLNGDGLSDLVVPANDEARLAIFLSQPSRVKARNP